MKLQRDDWDDEERRVLQDVGAELEQIRARHRGDPPFELLRAADADALPEPLQSGLAEHLSQSTWSRALVDGAAAADASLDPEAERRLLARVVRQSRVTPPAVRWWSRTWVPALAAAAVLVMAVIIFRRADPGRPLQPAPSIPETQVASAAAPAFTLPLDKAEVKLTAAALVLRSAGRTPAFVDEIAPALNAYRAGNYPDADKQFAGLQTRYPKSVEVAFYRGVSRLFLNDAPGAVDSLQAARRIDDETFAPDIAWYLAVAHERAGQRTRARAELDALCKGPSGYAAKACDAAPRITPE